MNVFGKIKDKTQVKVAKCANQLDTKSIITGIGSCFAQNILKQLYCLGMQGKQNPAGIIYNAVSIQKIITRIINEEYLTTNDFFQFNEKWHSWDLHGRFSEKELFDAVENAKSAFCTFRNYLEKSNLFVITPSSSVIYKHIKSNTITANCHKVPNYEFKREMLSVKENYEALSDTIKAVKKFNPKCSIMFTLSPVRHYPGDLVLNSTSKANLLSAINECIYDYEDILYFPSYEIVLDELRDYRYYTDDLLHINDTARRIILQRFMDAYIVPESIYLMKQNEKNIKFENHKLHGKI